MSKAHSDDKTVKAKGILTDITKCIGCERCVEACVDVNKLDRNLPSKFKVGDGLSADRYCSIVRVEKKKAAVRRQCMHCQEPACAAACLVGAFEKRPDGPVVYHAEKCIGCRYCMLACPFMIPRYEWDSLIPYVAKCKMNEDCRVAGGMPACVSACPTGATIFGTREELIDEAKRRIKEKPSLYFDHVFGEEEFGGTSVMYIAPYDMADELRDIIKMPAPKEMQKRGVASMEHHSIPHLVHGWVLATPFWFAGVFTGLWGLWLFRRRSKLMGPVDRGEHGAPDPGVAGFDEVCQDVPSEHHDDDKGKEGE